MSDVVLSCYYNIHINGLPLDDSRKNCLESVSLEELDDGSNTCTLVVSDPEFKYIEDNIFIEEATVYVEFGWWGETHRDTFFGYISAIDISFPENGFPQLTIYCLDNTHIMNRKKKTRSWDKVTRADVVKKIAAEYGFKCVVQSGYSSTVEDSISQSGVTDIEFCENLAGEERDLYKCKLVGNTLYYIKKGILESPKATVYYKKEDFDVISFTPKINKETRQESIDKADINTNTKATDSATANNSNTARVVQGEPGQTSYKNGGYEYEYNAKDGRWYRYTQKYDKLHSDKRLR